MTDDRNFIEKTQSRANGYYGRELSTDELATEFAKIDIDERVNHLEKMDADDARAEYSTPGEAAKAYVVRSALRNMHERLRKVDR